MSAVLAAILPGWRGDPYPAFFPRYVRFALRMSVLIVHVVALLRRGRTFGRLDAAGQEALVTDLAHVGLGPVRALVLWWKLLALVTQC